jgi:hypothetical protein
MIAKHILQPSEILVSPTLSERTRKLLQHYLDGPTPARLEQLPEANFEYTAAFAHVRLIVCFRLSSVGTRKQTLVWLAGSKFGQCTW